MINPFRGRFPPEQINDNPLPVSCSDISRTFRQPPPPKGLTVKITHEHDASSSWDHLAESALTELKQRYAKPPVEFCRKIVRQDEIGISKSRAQCEWFYRRCGTGVGASAGISSSISK
jgi:hypothetical protein